MKRIPLLLLVAAVLIPHAARAQGGDTVIYYHTDAIGSVRMITDASGAVIQRSDFLPFGQQWPPPLNPPDVRQFAGEERDPETKLDYFGARYFRPESGRFTTVDPVMNVESASTDPQRWNRYAYANNNPFRFVDPDGRDILPTAWNTGRGADGWLTGITSAAKKIYNLWLELNSPGHPGTPEAQARRDAQFLQPANTDEAVLMGLADVAMIAAPLMRSSAIGMIDASTVRFSQSSISASFRGGGSVDELAAGLRSGSVDSRSIPAIRLVERDGKLYSLDNRRLYAAQQAGVKIKYRMATPEEILLNRFKFTTINDGVSVNVRR